MTSPRGAAASDHHIYLTTPYKAIITIRPLRQSQERCGPETLRVGASGLYGPVGVKQVQHFFSSSWRLGRDRPRVDGLSSELPRDLLVVQSRGSRHLPRRRILHHIVRPGALGAPGQGTPLDPTSGGQARRPSLVIRSTSIPSPSTHPHRIKYFSTSAC